MVEADYVDRDYLEDYASYYLECFRPYERYCTRLHFFDGRVDAGELGRIVREGAAESDHKRVQEAYLGFTVGRPLSRSVIGRTVLARYEEDGKRHYPVTREYEPHLFGIPLPICSLAFQQQDSVVAACATVSLWSAFHKTQRIFDSLRPSPAKITEAANAIPGESRSMPSYSLSVEQMGQAIRDVGLEAEYVDVTPSTPLTSMLYGYVAMGIPAVLLVTFGCDVGHAVTVTGYSDGAPQKEEPIEALRYVGARIDQIFVHDDGVGPFAHMRIIDHAPELEAMKLRGEIDEDERRALMLSPYGLEWEYPAADGTRKWRLAIPVGLIIPLEKTIRLRWADMHGWLAKVAALLNVYERGFTFKVSDLEWDLRLAVSNHYKTSLRADGFAADEARDVVLKPYPKYIWQATARVGDTKIFEVTADATGVPDAFPFLDILFFEPGLRKQLRFIFSHAEAVDEWTRGRGRRMVNFLSGRESDDGIAQRPYLGLVGRGA